MKLILPTPHPKQREIINSSARRKVCVCGRRFGKTSCVSIMAVKAMLQGKIVLYACPSLNQTNAFWRNVKEYLSPLINSPEILYKNEQQRVIELLSNGGRIEAKTAWNADSLRGFFADLLILDEASFMNEDMWERVGSPMLLDRDGTGVFTFTPNRKNWAFRLYSRAASNNDPYWQAWHGTSFDNPYISQIALQRAINEMKEEELRQEVLAEFLEGQGSVFMNITACATLPEDQSTITHTGHRIGIGCDWGKESDYTVITGYCGDCKQQVFQHRSNKREYHQQVMTLKHYCDVWRPNKVLAEANAMGDPILEIIRREIPGSFVEPFNTTNESKANLMRELSYALERQEITLINNEQLKLELEAFEVKHSAIGRAFYSAPSGVNDDCVMGLALAYKAGTSASGGIPFAIIYEDGSIFTGDGEEVQGGR